MYKKILVPLDGSSLADSILPVIGELAARNNAEVLLLCVAAEPAVEIERANMSRISHAATDLLTGPHAPAQDRYDEELNHGQIAAQNILDDAHEQLRRLGVQSKAVVAFGDPGKNIIETAEAHHVDLIAMSTHGRTGLMRLVVGSVAEYVMAHTSVAVLLLRAAKPS